MFCNGQWLYEMGFVWSVGCVEVCQGLRAGLCGLDQGIRFVTKVSPVLLERTWFVWHGVQGVELG